MKKAKYTYAEAHNKAVGLFNKCVTVIFFIGLLNITGAILGCFNQQESLHYFPCMVSNILLFRVLSNTSLNLTIKAILNVLIAVSFASVFAYLWYNAKKGKIVYIFISIALYLVDFILTFIFFRGEGTFATQIMLHLIILAFLVGATMFYYQVLDIEKKFKQNNRKED